MAKQLLSALAALTLLVACGSDNTLSGDAGTTPTGGTPGTGGTTTTLSLGSGSGAGFQAGALLLSSSTLSAGGSGTITASLVDQNGTPSTQSATITFSSPCTGLNNASITPAAVTTTTGSATATYVAQGCTGADVITASTTIGSQTLTATGVITVAAPSAATTIVFESATPNNIGLRGTGRQETSTVIFRVVDSTGGPTPSANVNFSLNTTAGGMSISPATAVSGADGRVQTVVQSGTVATVVRVTAAIAATGASTQSSNLTVTTGIPDQDSVSLSATCFNTESYDRDGVPIVITARLADRNNNPVPDGTAVTMQAEGGSIVGACQTAAGACSATWTSQNPRPANGRVTILASAIGEESFTDNNGNGQFDVGEPFADQGEPFMDSDEDGTYDTNEPFFDFNNNGSRNVGDTFFNGVLCNDPARCSPTAPSAGIGDDLILVMSGSVANIAVRNSAFTDGAPPVSNVATVTASATPTTYQVAVVDARGNPMASGTTVAFATTNGSVTGTSTYTVGCTTIGPYVYGSGGTRFPMTVVGDTTPSTGTLTITVTSPGAAGGAATITTLNLNIAD